MKTIAYQGVEGSYSHMTAIRLFGPACTVLGLPHFIDVFQAVENEEADLALLPIENTLVGPIYEVLDLLGDSKLQIQKETKTRIEHCLLTLPEANLEQIEKVYSHPKALGQCLKFFRKYPFLSQEVYVDTAAAASFVAKKKDPTIAAIASKSAATLHGLKVALHNLEDNPENYTRFILLGKEAAEGKKCLLRFTLNHQPGTLALILNMIAQEGVN